MNRLRPRRTRPGTADHRVHHVPEPDGPSRPDCRSTEAVFEPGVTHVGITMANPRLRRRRRALRVGTDEGRRPRHPDPARAAAASNLATATVESRLRRRRTPGRRSTGPPFGNRRSSSMRSRDSGATSLDRTVVDGAGRVGVPARPGADALLVAVAGLGPAGSSCGQVPALSASRRRAVA